MKATLVWKNPDGEVNTGTLSGDSITVERLENGDVLVQRWQKDRFSPVSPITEYYT